MKTFLLALALGAAVPASAQTNSWSYSGSVGQNFSIYLNGAPGLYTWNIKFDDNVVGFLQLNTGIATNYGGAYIDRVTGPSYYVSQSDKFSINKPTPTYPGSPDVTWVDSAYLSFDTIVGANAHYTAQVKYYAAVPEAAAWGMMILGMGLGGAMLRRRSHQHALSL